MDDVWPGLSRRLGSHGPSFRLALAFTVQSDALTNKDNDGRVHLARPNQDCASSVNEYSSSVTALEQIHQMPLREKLLVMEAIWNDICREEQNLEVPQWHKDILDERERMVADGKAQFIDWEEAKKQIKEATE